MKRREISDNPDRETLNARKLFDRFDKQREEKKSAARGEEYVEKLGEMAADIPISNYKNFELGVLKKIYHIFKDAGLELPGGQKIPFLPVDMAQKINTIGVVATEIDDKKLALTIDGKRYAGTIHFFYEAFFFYRKRYLRDE